MEGLGAKFGKNHREEIQKFLDEVSKELEKKQVSFLIRLIKFGTNKMRIRELNYRNKWFFCNLDGAVGEFFR